MASYRFQLGDHVIFTFTENPSPYDGYHLTISGSGAMWDDDRAPEPLDGNWPTYPVAIRGCLQETVTIPDGITTIYPTAFAQIGRTYNNSVKQIIVGRDIEEIGHNAFSAYYDSSSYDPDYKPDGEGTVKSITFLGNKVKKLGSYCFEGQTEIQELDFYGSVELIGKYACFRGCHKLERLYLKDDWEFINDFNNGQDDYGEAAFWKCYKLWRISDNNTICCIGDDESGGHIHNDFQSNYYCNECLQSVTVRNPIDDTVSKRWDEYRPDLEVPLYSGSVLDPNGYFITDINTTFESLINAFEAFKFYNNRIIRVTIEGFKVYVYHMGRIIELRGGDTGDIPVAHEGTWKGLKCIQSRENPAYSPIHFVHNGQWYQFKY